MAESRQVWKLYMIIDNRRLDISYDAEAAERVSDDAIIQEVKKQVHEIQEQLSHLDEFIGPKKIRDAIKAWPLGALTTKDIDTIELFLQNIDECYAKFYHHVFDSGYCCDPIEAHLKESFQTVEGDIGIIRKLTTNKEKSLSNQEDLVAAIAGFAIVRGADICEAPQVISNILIQLFKMIIIAELKTSTMLAYENIYEYVRNKGQQLWRRTNSLGRDTLEMQFAIYVNMFSLNMAVIDGVYNRACDPPGGNWIRDESFYELERTFQATVFRYNWSNCRFLDCNSVVIGTSRICRPWFYGEPVSTSSGDTVAECAYLSNITACVLTNGPHSFQYVDSNELGFLGRNSSCPKDNGEIVKTGVVSYSVYAACTCTSYRNHNKISLSMIGSDVESNRVVTGLRFVRKNEVLYIQPREGTLESNGYINRVSQRWIPIPGNINSSLIELINKENRVFFLDDVILPATHILTGIQFDKVTREKVTGFAIKIFGTYFDYRTGKLFLEEDSRPSWSERNEKSGKSLSFNPVSSVFTTLPHTVTPSDTKYVPLERSTLEEDFGQSTLPLFDAVPITFEVPSALGGVGMFHKGVEGYAGLVSLRVYGINYKQYFDDFQVFHVFNGRVLFNSSFN